MPSDTFYNLKRLHRLFAVSAAALLATTLWMLAVDHRREWKEHQRTFRDRIEPWTTEAALRQQSGEEFIEREAELQAALDAERQRPLDSDRLERFRAEIERDAQQRGVPPPDFSRCENAEGRSAKLAVLRQLAAEAERRRELAERRLRFARAEWDQARSRFEAGVAQKIPLDQLEVRRAEVQRLNDEVARCSAAVDRAALHHRNLANLLCELTAGEEAALRALSEHRAEVERLERALLDGRSTAARRALRLPLIDALARPLAIEQIWLPELTISYNVRDVARFDRCITCHQAMDKVFPGEDRPAYFPESTFTADLPTPTAAPPADATLAGVYGFSLVPHGMLGDGPAIGYVRPRSPAARAGLYAGDAIEAIDESPVADIESIQQRLLARDAWGRPARLSIARGVPHPYRTHPRLDLYVGPQSPHPMSEFGCTVCHDGQGSATEFKYASHAPNCVDQRQRWTAAHGWFENPDWAPAMRPARFAESNCLKCHHQVPELEASDRYPQGTAAKLVEGYHLVRQNGCFGCHEIKGLADDGTSFGPDMRLEPSGATNNGPPGTLRKAGPSLRHVGDKLSRGFLARHVGNPAEQRPESRMPRLFGLTEQLDGPTLQQTERLEAVELAAVAEFLLSQSRPLEAAASPTAAAPSVEEGKKAFQRVGCLACHSHADFPTEKATDGWRATVGPDLSRLGAKLNGGGGAKWLVSWLRDPARHSPRTPMPNMLLTVQPVEAKAGQKPPPPRDPAADIAAYLLADPAGAYPPPSYAADDLDALALEHLGRLVPKPLAEQYLHDGVSEKTADLPADLEELRGPATAEKKLRFVGRRTVRKRGCYGCHDIAGFEQAPLIGPALTGWGRKQESLLAFEQVVPFLDTERGSAAGEPDLDFYRTALRDGRREGYLWQKLRAPRSFDYRKAENKAFNEQLLMGRFSFSARQREAIATFILGLVNEPPKGKYVYRPGPRQAAIIAGRKVLDEYGCATCHVLGLERWRVQFEPDRVPALPGTVEYASLQPRPSPAAVAASARPDRRGLLVAELAGAPQRNARGELEESEDEDGNPVHAFQLWEPAALGGKVWPVGGAGVLVSPAQLGSKRPAWGGELARLLYPVVLREAQQAGATAGAMEAWGWVPPALVHEGRRVQPAWLYDYLLEPYPIRPAAVLRMPQFSLSPDEARRLTDYFAATAGVEFPYASAPAARMARLEALSREPAKRFEKALGIVTDRTTYCAKCHLIGDHGPGGTTKTVLAPNLERVGRRIRPEYLRQWLANPRSVLPYTAMPVNFPPGPDGKPPPELDAVLELLVNYEAWLRAAAPAGRL